MTGRPDDPAGDGIAVQRLRFLFRLFAGTQCRGRSPVYEALSEGIAGDSQYLVGASLRAPGEHGHGSGPGDVAVLALADPCLRWLAPARRPGDDFRWLPEVIASDR